MAEPTFARHVLDRLGAAIVAGDHPSGAVLRIGDLEAEFRVSRTVVRDALRSLESLNMVEARRSIGITVSAASQWDVFARDVIRWRLESHEQGRQMRSLTVVRAAIEPVAAALAATVDGHEAVGEQLTAMADAMRKAGREGDLAATLEWDLAFHQLILHTCGNEMLAALDKVVEQVLRARHDLRLRPHRPHAVPMLLHSVVAAAIRDGDATVAETAMRHLVIEVIEDVAKYAALGRGGGA